MAFITPAEANEVAARAWRFLFGSIRQDIARTRISGLRHGDAVTLAQVGHGLAPAQLGLLVLAAHVGAIRSEQRLSDQVEQILARSPNGKARALTILRTAGALEMHGDAEAEQIGRVGRWFRAYTTGINLSEFAALTGLSCDTGSDEYRRAARVGSDVLAAAA